MQLKKSIGYCVVVVLAAAFGGDALAHGPTHNKLRFGYLKANPMSQKYENLLNPLATTSENLKAGS